MQFQAFRVSAVSLQYNDVDNLLLILVDGQIQFGHPFRQALPDSNWLAHFFTVDHNIVGIPFKPSPSALSDPIANNG